VASRANRSSGWGGGCFEDQCCGRWDRKLAVRRGVRLLVLIARTGPTPATESSAPRASEPCPKRRLFAGSGRSFGGVWSSCSWLPEVLRLPVEKGSFQIRNRLPYVSDRLSVLRTTHGSVRPFRPTVGREWFLTSGSCAAHRARRLFLTVGPIRRRRIIGKIPTEFSLGSESDLLTSRFDVRGDAWVHLSSDGAFWLGRATWVPHRHLPRGPRALSWKCRSGEVRDSRRDRSISRLALCADRRNDVQLHVGAALAAR
jgi:hypothetical protein